MNKKPFSLGIAILAAGASTRLGTPKQLLEWQPEKTLLQHAIRETLHLASPLFSTKSIVVVLGANAETIESTINTLDITVVGNSQWQSGMASSIRVGVKALQSISCDAALIALCDQPLVTSEHYKQLIERYTSSDGGIAACRYADVLGVPAIFSERYFEELCVLEHDRGARILLQKYAADVAALDCPEAECDLDSPEDYCTAKGLVL